MVTLRKPRPDELPGLSLLCRRSKALWGYDEAFLAACGDELTLTPVDLRDDGLRVALEGRVPVGVVQIALRGAEASLEKLFVAPERIGTGVGRTLFQWAFREARAAGSQRLTIEADPEAVGFYKRMGAHEEGFAASASIPGRMLPRLSVPLATPRVDRLPPE